MKKRNGTQEPDYRLFQYFALEKDGAVLRVSVYLPGNGTGSLKGRLLRLMENELREQGKGYGLRQSHPMVIRKTRRISSKSFPTPEAAEKVRYIFRLCAAGMGSEQIAKRLERERVLVPMEYAYRTIPATTRIFPIGGRVAA